jgi:hypothetical protein
MAKKTRAKKQSTPVIETMRQAMRDMPVQEREALSGDAIKEFAARWGKGSTWGYKARNDVRKEKPASNGKMAKPSEIQPADIKAIKRIGIEKARRILQLVDLLGE